MAAARPVHAARSPRRRRLHEAESRRVGGLRCSEREGHLPHRDRRVKADSGTKGTAPETGGRRWRATSSSPPPRLGLASALWDRSPGRADVGRDVADVETPDLRVQLPDPGATFSEPSRRGGLGWRRRGIGRRRFPTQSGTSQLEATLRGPPAAARPRRDQVRA